MGGGRGLSSLLSVMRSSRRRVFRSPAPAFFRPCQAAVVEPSRAEPSHGVWNKPGRPRCYVSSVVGYWASGRVCFPALMTLIKGLWPGTMRCLTMGRSCVHEPYPEPYHLRPQLPDPTPIPSLLAIHYQCYVALKDEHQLLSMLPTRLYILIYKNVFIVFSF